METRSAQPTQGADNSPEAEFIFWEKSEDNLYIETGREIRSILSPVMKPAERH